jgi:hypothetical protein
MKSVPREPDTPPKSHLFSKSTFGEFDTASYWNHGGPAVRMERERHSGQSRVSLRSLDWPYWLALGSRLASARSVHWFRWHKGGGRLSLIVFATPYGSRPHSNVRSSRRAGREGPHAGPLAESPQNAVTGGIALKELNHGARPVRCGNAAGASQGLGAIGSGRAANPTCRVASRSCRPVAGLMPSGVPARLTVRRRSVMEFRPPYRRDKTARRD